MENTSNAVWSRDGTHIYFDSDRVADPAIYRVYQAGHKIERLISLKDFRLTSLVQSTMTLAPDDSPYCCVILAFRRFTRSTWQPSEVIQRIVTVPVRLKTISSFQHTIESKANCCNQPWLSTWAPLARETA